MDRYRHNKIVNQKYNTSRLPVPDVSHLDVYIISRSGDRLDILAHQFYDDITLWWIIAAANNLRSGSFIIPEGLQIRIPKNLLGLDQKLERIEKER